MRLIDADKLYNVIQDFSAIYEEAREMKDDVLLEISETPTVDAVVVTRCKDCARYRMGACEKVYTDGNVFSAAWQERKPDDFCSYGEPKEG